MHTLYHHLGFLVFWGIIAAFCFAVGWRACLALPAGTYRQLSHLRTAFRAFVLRRPHRLGEGAARTLPLMCKVWKARRWERNLMAYIIRYNRRTGYVLV